MTPADSTNKQTNPKDAMGIKKVPLSCVPLPVAMELGIAMLEGARRYGRHNYRVIGVRASVYSTPRADISLHGGKVRTSTPIPGCPIS